jgi:acyl dehydratase
MTDALKKAFATMKSRIGNQASQTQWFEVSQQRIKEFADVTMDHQWIHVDVERASKPGALWGTYRPRAPDSVNHGASPEGRC